MKEKILIRGELLGRVGIPDAILRDMEQLHLVSPAGKTEEGMPFYTEAHLIQIGHIRRLQEMGYSLEEIQRIAKKIGLPRTADAPPPGKPRVEQLTIGGLARRVGVSPRTIKHWEDKGIIEPDMRSEGGFRLYPEIYVYLCRLIQDLQLFGYSLHDIKRVSDLFRLFLSIEKDPGAFTKKTTERHLDRMQKEIDRLFSKMNLFKEGVTRWEELLTRKKKEIAGFKKKNQKRSEPSAKES